MGNTHSPIEDGLPSIEQLKSKVFEAVQRLLENDSFLIEKQIHEMALSFRLGFYLVERFEPDFDVDCEYNRELDNPKRRDNSRDPNSQRPDVIVHKRGENSSNLIVIEIKKSHSSKTAISERRNIEDWMAAERFYRLGVRVAFEWQDSSAIGEVQFKTRDCSWEVSQKFIKRS